MADEIKANFSLSASKANFEMRRSASQSITLSAASPAKASGVMAVGTTEEAIPLGDLAANGVAWFKNNDATNYIEIGIVVTATFYPFLKLKAGEAWPLRLTTGIAPYARANTAACKLDYEILDN